MRNPWYKNAIAYSLDVETFLDSDGDGVGDFQGLTQQLDYLVGLGINCLWLLPFYPSPNRDNGYDVMDYYNVDPRLGTLGDFVEFMHGATERGIRVIIDLVVNHTSIQHPWFQAARSSKESKYRDYYVWSDNPPPTKPEQISFPGTQKSIWTYDEQAQSHYLHHFYDEQPDLNTANPEVREEIRKIMGFWLELGVSGFRIDAAPFIIEPMGMEGVTDEELQSILPEMHEFLVARKGDAVLLAEANVPPEKIPLYFGNGDRMHMLFNFLVNQHLFLALARQDSAPLWDGLKTLPPIPNNGQWFNFVRHHDELTLDQLSEAERQEIFKAFAPEESMQIYGRGVRRRLAPMVKGDRRQMELAYSLAFSLPGTPVLRYGDEIGMGDDLKLEGRNSVRTVMQWSSEENGGFSAIASDNLTQPLISEGEYGYSNINVATQQRDPVSLLNWMERMIRTRKQCPEFGRGSLCILETDEPCVFAHCCEWNGKAVMAVHNLSDRDCTTTIHSTRGKHLIEIMSNCTYEPIQDDSPAVTLTAYGYRWFRINHLN